MDWENALKTGNGEEISLKGFLYYVEEGHWVLSTQPNLKSCCLGATHLHNSQVHLTGDFSSYPAHIPLKIKGTWQNNHEMYHLIEPKVISEPTFPVWTLGLGFFGLILVGFILKRLLLP